MNKRPWKACFQLMSDTTILHQVLKELKKQQGYNLRKCLRKCQMKNLLIDVRLITIPTTNKTYNTDQKNDWSIYASFIKKIYAILKEKFLVTGRLEGKNTQNTCKQYVVIYFLIGKQNFINNKDKLYTLLHTWAIPIIIINTIFYLLNNIWVGKSPSTQNIYKSIIYAW